MLKNDPEQYTNQNDINTEAAGYILHSEQTDHYIYHLLQSDYEQLPNKLGHPLLNRYVM